ncbi:tyrosine-type recombinase/integrase [Enterococcus sp. HY326]|uniref:tyrosine-type recombinase/integrase n=1 Tax=Enterococcus sp. HY326 TaxID=2971265 RepID=UPI0022403042|nr:tyrosine-type recombinase/integrase [Enterococcus sp. HY326]
MLDLTAYRNYLLENETEKNTIKNYMVTLKQLDKFLVNRRLDLSKEVLIEYKQHLQEDEYRPGRKYQLKTINQKIVILNIYFNWLDRHDLCLKYLKVQTKVHRESIDKKEYRQLLKHADEEMYLFILLIGSTGLRISEACSIRADELELRIVTIKNKGKTRYISIPQFVKKKLKKFCRKRRISTIIFHKSQDFYRKRLKTIAGKAKVKKEKVYPHTVRHFFAKEFIANGGDSTDLQQMLGHESIATTTIYTKLSTNELSEKYREIRNE